ncbi:MAG TPA: tetratricopeptide repeat protein [Candidatus Polarisedimenticolaceae bacterium]|nr:tetratricopeptide repeat protein [Candidatus Polarisedimenticolaceae bacterium]
MRRSLAPVLIAALLSPAALAGTANQVRKDAFRLLNEGVAAYNRGAFRDAIPPLQQAATMSLNSFRAHYFLGLALAGDRRYSEAVESYRVALDLDPSHLQANVSMADAWLAQGDADEGSPYYARALKLRAEYAPALDGQGRVAQAQADDDKAIAMFTRAIASDKGYAQAYMDLGDLYLRQNRLDDAVKLLIEAVSVRPDYTPALNRLATAYGMLGFTNEAVATIRKAIDLEPKNPEHHATLGEVLLRMGVTTGAEAAFREAIAIDPAQPRAWAGLAELARRRGDYPGAIGDLDTALADSRLDHRTKNDLTAKRAAIVAESEKAGALEAKVASPEATWADKLALAEVEAGREHWDRAADLMIAAEAPDAPSERRAYYLFRAGRFKDAHAAYARLAQAAPSADLEVNAGAALARLGDDAHAKEAYDRALAIDPANAQAQMYRANALLRLGDTAAATAAYQAFLAAHPTGDGSEQVKRVLEQLGKR